MDSDRGTTRQFLVLRGTGLLAVVLKAKLDARVFWLFELTVEETRAIAES